MNHDLIMQTIYDIFRPNLPRLAPGDDHSTRRALAALGDLASEPRILDIGCGNGAQTLCLAEATGGRITAVDNHQPYLDELNARAVDRGLSRHITTRCEDMNTLDLGGATVDLVWAEGSSFIMGLERALKAWRGFLPSGGGLAFTELTWFEDHPPQGCLDYFKSAFFEAENPALASKASHLATIDTCGFDVIEHFSLPERSWWENFYDPLQERLMGYRAPDHDEGRAVSDMVHGEIDNYRQYSRWYGYEFFVLRAR